MEEEINKGAYSINISKKIGHANRRYRKENYAMQL
jgi:hypothetical protein